MPDDEFATAWDLMGHVDGLVLLSSRIQVTELQRDRPGEPGIADNIRTTPNG